MSLNKRNADDATNRRITVLVFNKDTEQEIKHKNAESNATDITERDSLKQVIPHATPAPTNSGSPAKEAPVSQDAEDQKTAAEAKTVTDKERPQNYGQQEEEKRTDVIVT